jgi:hypothetical protein
MRRQASALCAWWLGEMLAMLPARARPWLLPDRRRVVVSPSEGGLVARIALPSAPGTPAARWREDAAGWEPATAYEAIQALGQTREVDLEVPPPLALRQQVRLPRAALANLASAVSYGLPTWSPFSADEVWVAARIDHADGPQATIGLAYAPKAQIAPFIALATQAGLPPDRLVFDAKAQWATVLGTPKMRRLKRARLIDRGLAAATVFLALTLSSAVLLRQSQELGALQTALRSELDAVRRDESNRKAVEELAARRTIVARRRAAEPSASEVLAALGARLPASAALSLIEISGMKGRIEVVGPGSGEVAGALRATPPFVDPTPEASLPGRPLGTGFRLARDLP